MTRLPAIRSHNSTSKGFTTYFDDVHDHRLEAEYEHVCGVLIPRHFRLFRANRAAAHFRIYTDGNIIFTWKHPDYTAEQISPFLASIQEHHHMVNYGHLPSPRSLALEEN